MNGHGNTHVMPSVAVKSRRVVLALHDGAAWVGVSFGLGGWKPARPATRDDFEGFNPRKPYYAKLLALVE